jgi:hypothetical protein
MIVMQHLLAKHACGVGSVQDNPAAVLLCLEEVLFAAIDESRVDLPHLSTLGCGHLSAILCPEDFMHPGL